MGRNGRPKVDHASIGTAELETGKENDIGVLGPGKLGCQWQRGCMGSTDNDAAVCHEDGELKRTGEEEHWEKLSHAITLQNHEQGWSSALN